MTLVPIEINDLKVGDKVKINSSTYKYQPYDRFFSLNENYLFDIQQIDIDYGSYLVHLDSKQESFLREERGLEDWERPEIYIYKEEILVCYREVQEDDIIII